MIIKISIIYFFLFVSKHGFLNVVYIHFDYNVLNVFIPVFVTALKIRKKNNKFDNFYLKKMVSYVTYAGV